MKHIYKAMLFVFFFLVGISSCSDDKNDSPKIEKEPFQITEQILYEKDIWDLINASELNGVYLTIQELERRAVTKDTKSVRRLMDIFLVSDGFLTELVEASLNSVFKSDPESTLNIANTYPSNDRDSIYKVIIYNAYYGDLLDKKYPENYQHIKSLGPVSERFIRMLEYYMNNPTHIEDWSIEPTI